jgi:hypothetical protein
VLRSWPGYLPPLVVGCLTLFLVWIQDTAIQLSVEAESTVSPLLALAGLLSLAVLLVVPVLWGGAVLASRPWYLAPVAAGVWLALSLVISTGTLVWPLAFLTAAGLATGLAFLFRLRPAVALLVVSLVLAPYLIWAVVEFFENWPEMSSQILEMQRELYSEKADPEQVELALAEKEDQLEESMALVRKILPATLGLEIMGLAAVLLALVWLEARILGLAIAPLGFPPFRRWKLPFYLVWTLVVGLGLVLTRQEVLATAGWNVVLVAATLFSLQGAAVQWEMTRPTMGLVVRIIYLLVAGLVFLPLVLLGLADQWLDFRKLEASDEGGAPDDSKGG